jgi:hypothetical protein
MLPPQWNRKLQYVHILLSTCLSNQHKRTLVASAVAGRLSDASVEKRKAARNGIWDPEDRLLVILTGGVFVPLSVGLSGLITTYIPGPLGLALNLLCLFMNGVGVSQTLVDPFSLSRLYFTQVDFVLTPIGSYNVDVVQSRSAEVIAAVTWVAVETNSSGLY